MGPLADLCEICSEAYQAMWEISKWKTFKCEEAVWSGTRFHFFYKMRLVLKFLFRHYLMNKIEIYFIWFKYKISPIISFKAILLFKTKISFKL